MEKPQNKYTFGRHELIEQRKDKKRIKSKLVIISLFLGINIFLLLFLRSGNFTVAEISIYGMDKLSQEEVRAAMGIREGMNIWKISPPELKKRILTIPRVADAKVERVLPDNLNIIIKEKIPLILVPYHGYYLELAPDGIFIGIRESYDGELPLVNGLLWGRMDVGTGIPDQARGEIVQDFLEVLTEKPSLPLAEINVENPQEIIVYTWEGMEVWLGNSLNLSKKIEVMQHIYNRVVFPENDPKSGYLDLRVTEAPVYRPIEK